MLFSALFETLSDQRDKARKNALCFILFFFPFSAIISLFYRVYLLCHSEGETLPSRQFVYFFKSSGLFFSVIFTACSCLHFAIFSW